MKTPKKNAAEMAELSRLGHMAPKLDPIQRAEKNPGSRALAIKGKCYDCQGRDADPHWQWRVGNCDIPKCPLYSVRPYQAKMGTETPPALREQ